MNALNLAGVSRVLCLGAHPDDIEIGCGGTILTLAAAVPHLTVRWVVFGAERARKQEALTAAERFLRGVDSKTISLHDFRDGFFPYSGARVKEAFEELKVDFAPDLVFTHQRTDAHQDHRLVAELTWNTFRHHLILEYEIPKYDGDFGSPNFFSALPKATLDRKVDLVLAHFPSQAGKPWFTEDLFRAVARIRGMEAAAPEGLAEGFYCRKAVF